MSENDLLQEPRPPSPTQTPGRRWPSSRVRLAGYAAGVMLVAGLAGLAFWLAAATRSTPAPETAPGEPTSAVATPVNLDRTVVSADDLVARSGVRIVYVAVTGGGGLLDLRFQVIDPDKADAVHDPDTPPALVDAQTGLVVDQLLMGHSHSGKYTAGQTYYLVFENPGNLVQQGGTVSVLLGDAQVDGVTVR